ncbi:solute carrier family 52, riboflavin transporter, member 3-A [Colossoma macropomum]|uniref:solute carrier family 52, riboflavin transporter, member 3-A n=1 Tax=Colossoma macropomum TaxID=42526 RepID=UPI0018652372|nr:solute carrier family 52, riboflavin transporter, member 3-A [Colossoma macropomum]XP_036434643.1 solute carrier family 52, riboflavin transporter, member 3-A [Colossoma macropomum]
MSLYIHLLACAFGLGSWVAINGLWVELPLIVNVLPEAWDLPSYLTVIIQLANLGPLLVTIAHKLCPGRLRENVAICVVLTIGVVACILLTVFWRNTTVFLGAPRSTAFFVLTFFLALVDCTSSVTFLPFMMQLPAKYITTYFIGEGLSGFVPGLVALGQGAGMFKCVNVSQTSGNLSQPGDESFAVETQYLPPNFSTEVFFSFLVVMMVVSLVAFAMLNRVPRTYELSTECLVPKSGTVDSVSGGLDNPAVSNPNPKTKTQEDDLKDQSRPLVVKPFYSRCELAFIYLMVVWVNGATNGLLPSVQTYSCMPYGNMAYHLSAALASVANPLACIIAMFAPKRSLVFLGILCLLGTGFGGYNMAMAAMSPCPLLQGSPVGEAIIVLSWVFFTGLLSYVKVMVGVILRDQSHNALVWCGAAVQLGSLVGSLIMFPLVNIYHLFQSGDICNTKCPL